MVISDCTPVKSRTNTVRASARKPMTPPRTVRPRRTNSQAGSSHAAIPLSPCKTVVPASKAARSTVSASSRPSHSRSSSTSTINHRSKPTFGTGPPSPTRTTAASEKPSVSGRRSAASSPSKQTKRPSSRGLKTGVRIPYQAADRFIPNRNASEPNVAKLERAPSRASSTTSFVSSGGDAYGTHDDLALALDSLALKDDDDSQDDADKNDLTTASDPGYQSLATACGVKLNTRILAFKPAPPESSKPIDLRTQYTRPARAAPVTQRRRIAIHPERVLDAPSILDDYYLNLLDWSCNNQVVIGLNQSVYVWSAETGDVALLLESDESTYVSSLKWSDDGAFISVGLGSGEVQIWDVESEAKIRSMFGHESRVSAQSWSKHILSTGARNGWLYNHDVRIAQHHVATLDAHTSEVCGLEWRADGAQLASGGNDNLVAIWDARNVQTPKFAKTNHTAAVKALSWCPWQLNLLATGGGSADRHIHFWNTTSGARVNSIDTGSQVTSLRWSTVPGYKEVASTSGYPDNSVSVWSYPSLARVADIQAHESRILHSTLSPDGQTLATAAADENLKFWKIFERRPGSVVSSGAGVGADKDAGGLTSGGMLR